MFGRFISSALLFVMMIVAPTLIGFAVDGFYLLNFGTHLLTHYQDSTISTQGFIMAVWCLGVLGIFAGTFVGYLIYSYIKWLRYG